MNKPYIVCAATHYDNNLSYLNQPDNINSGYVVCGLRHNNITYLHNQLSPGLTGRRKDSEGFLTSNNLFVNRQQAAKIAFEAGQIETQPILLYSEHLY
jgi:hypothetical protein